MLTSTSCPPSRGPDLPPELETQPRQPQNRVGWGCLRAPGNVATAGSPQLAALTQCRTPVTVSHPCHTSLSSP